jgi:hypothetical protein
LWIIQQNKSNYYLDIGLLVHESIHATTLLFEKCGIVISYQNDESICYMVQFIIESTLSQLGQYFNLKQNWDIDRFPELKEIASVRVSLDEEQKEKVKELQTFCNDKSSDELFLDQIGIHRITKWLNDKDLVVYSKQEKFIEMSKFEALDKRLDDKIKTCQELRTENKNLTDCVDSLVHIKRKLEKELEIANQYRDTREENLDKARGVHPLSQDKTIKSNEIREGGC